MSGPLGQRYWRAASSRTSYLSVVKYRAVAVEELEGVYDLALHQSASDDSCGGPPSGANGHLPKPLFQREAVAFSHHSVHFVQLVSVPEAMLMTGGCVGRMCAG